ncbi:hypothetical protein M9H77_22164 [Catharanthus roseus]|uniref:Uncharacterized protein n=1 Tax=Catharanthus roseus TaxID=4058 RepID=A0ACC0AQE0_CATRO|nr:hypothetical protein M9H77_22164 [Catharanthus roseus]
MAPSGLSRKTGKKKVSIELDSVVEDRISNLPDSILYFILSFLPTLHSVRTILLSKSYALLWFLHYFGNATTSFPKLPRLSKLPIKVICCQWKILINILESSVNLETFILQKELTDGKKFHDPSWKNSTRVPKCMLSSLRRISIINYHDCEDDIKLIKYFLQHGIVLEKIDQYVVDSLGIKAKHEMHVLESGEVDLGTQEMILGFNEAIWKHSSFLHNAPSRDKLYICLSEFCISIYFDVWLVDGFPILQYYLFLEELFLIGFLYSFGVRKICNRIGSFYFHCFVLVLACNSNLFLQQVVSEPRFGSPAPATIDDSRSEGTIKFLRSGQ